MDNGQTVTAAGSLLAFMQRSQSLEDVNRKKRGRKQLEDDEEEDQGGVLEVEVEAIEDLALEAHLQISEETLR